MRGIVERLIEEGGVDLIQPDGSRGITDLYGSPTATGDSANGAYTTDSDLTQIKSSMVPRVQVIRGDKTETLEFYRDTTQ